MCQGVSSDVMKIRVPSTLIISVHEKTNYAIIWELPHFCQTIRSVGGAFSVLATG